MSDGGIHGKGGFHLIQGDLTTDFVCTWCASRFATRADLDEHWEVDPACKSNRNVSNPLQSKYGSAYGLENIPGEPVLTRVRAAGCLHPENLREPLFSDLYATGQSIGWRCGYCYTEVRT